MRRTLKLRHGGRNTDEMKRGTQTQTEGLKPLPGAQCSDSSWQTNYHLFCEALLVTNALSMHLERIGDTERMYKVNKAYKILLDAR